MKDFKINIFISIKSLPPTNFHSPRNNVKIIEKVTPKKIKKIYWKDDHQFNFSFSCVLYNYKIILNIYTSVAFIKKVLHLRLIMSRDKLNDLILIFFINFLKLLIMVS